MKSTTLVNLPIRGHAEPTPDVMTTNGRLAPARSLTRRRLLVVDDDPIIRAALRSGLELHGYEVAAAGNGLEALDVLARLMPDLIVLDLAMPGMSGPRFFEELMRKGLRPQLRVVVVSASPDVHDLACVMGADGHLRKPLQLAALVREIERTLGR